MVYFVKRYLRKRIFLKSSNSKKRGLTDRKMVGVRGFEPPVSTSRT